MAGGTLIVSRAKNLFTHYQKRLLELGFKDVEITGEEKDSLNSVINELKPRLVLVGSGFYHAGTPYMMGLLLNSFPKLNIAAVSLGEFPDDLAAWFIWHGVKSYVNLWEGLEEFYHGLHEVREGKAYIAPQVQKVLDQYTEWPETKTKVTNRLMEVLILLCNGFIPEDIGVSLHISRNTVTDDLNQLYRMFHVKNREGMVAVAWDLGIVTGQDMCFYDRKQDDMRTLPQWAAIKGKINNKTEKRK
jgi:DNA-binding NarL/FixJ family response regulator